jgi:DNA-binding beta-propeller fold protein YncE
MKKSWTILIIPIVFLAFSVSSVSNHNFGFAASSVIDPQAYDAPLFNCDSEVPPPQDTVFPEIPSSPEPANNMNINTPSPTLFWIAGANSLTFDVYLGTQNPPVTLISSNQSETALPIKGLSDNVTYYWKVVARHGNNVVSGDVWKFKKIAGAAYLSCPYAITKMKPDRRTNKIYGIDFNNGLFIVIDTLTLAIIKTVALLGNPYDFDLGKDFCNAWITIQPSQELVEIDLKDFTILRRIPLDYEAGTVASGRTGRVFVAGYNQWSYVLTIDTNNGDVINQLEYNYFYKPGIITNTDGSILYITESATSSGSSVAFDVSDDSVSPIIDQAPETSYSGKFLFLSKKDQKLFFDKHWVEASQMSHDHGSIAECTCAVTYSGDYMISLNAVYYSSTFSKVQSISGSCVMAVTTGDQELYAFKSALNRIDIVNLTGIPADPVPPSTPTTDPSGILIDPNRDIIYVIDKSANTLMFFNANTLALEKAIFVCSQPQDMDIDPAGNYLYLACWGGREIAVVDLASQTKSRSIFFNDPSYSLSYYPKIACGKNGILYYAPGSGWDPVYILDSNDGSTIKTFGSFSGPALVLDSTKNILYVGESDTSSGDCLKYDVSDDQNPVLLPYQYNTSYPSRILKIDNSDKYVFYKNFKLDAGNLSQLIEFPAQIKSISIDGAYVFVGWNVYDAATGALIKTLPSTSTYPASKGYGNKIIYYDSALPGLTSAFPY